MVAMNNIVSIHSYLRDVSLNWRLVFVFIHWGHFAYNMFLFQTKTWKFSCIFQWNIHFLMIALSAMFVLRKIRIKENYKLTQGKYGLSIFSLGQFRIRINFENLISKCSTVLNELEYSKLFSHRFEDRFITELKLKNFLQTQFRLNKLK